MVQRRQAALIYLFPALQDLVVALIFFVGSVRAARWGGGATKVALVAAAWSVVYVCACPVIGRLVTARNAHRLALSGCLLLTLVSGLLAVADGFEAMLVLVGVSGLATALFFPPFQVLMKAMDTAGGRSVAYSTGLYTFSWSTGFACGPFVSGFLMQFGRSDGAAGEGVGWRYAFLFGAVVSAATAAALWYFLRVWRATPHESAAVRVAHYDSKPDLAWLGWISGGAGFIALSIIRAVFPARAVGVLHLADATLGTIFFVVSMAQALTGLMLMRSRFWMYRPRAVAAFSVLGMLGTLGFGLGSRPAMLIAGAVLFGIYSGSFCFYFVFHSLIHPHRGGQYVSVNETIVGITGIVAPLIGGVLADTWGFQCPYLVAAALIFAVTALQVRIHGRRGGGGDPSRTAACG